MSKPLRVLIVEDSENDALLMIRELEKGGYEPAFARVETKEAMDAALDKQEWDIILCDYSLPHFNAIEALKVVKGREFDIPFIIISGSIGEDIAVQAMKAGANDYFMKGSLTRLSPIVEQEIGEARHRRKRKEAEEALRRSEIRYRQLFEQSNDAIFIADAHTKMLVDCNKKAEEMTGYSKSEICSMNAAELHPDDRAAQTMEDFREQVGGMRKSVESEILTKDKRRVYVSINAAVMEIEGKPRLMGVFRDIAELKKAEEETKAIKQQIEFILGATKTGLDIIDSDFNIIYIDPEWQKVYGDYKGRKCYEYFSGRDTMCLNCAIPAAMELKKPVISEEVLPKEGNRPIMVTTIPFQDEKGKWLVAEVNVDITERKKVEEEIRDSEERLKILFEYAPDAYFLTDLKGILIDGNRLTEKLTGYKREELTGNNILKLNLLPLNQIAKAAALFAQGVLGKSTGPHEFTLNRKDGSKVTAEISTFPVKIKDCTLVLGIAHDITERKRSEAQLINAAKEWRATFDSIGDLISIHDKDFKIVRSNMAFANAFKMQPKEILGKTCYGLLHKEKGPLAGCPHQLTMQNKKINVAEMFISQLGIYAEITCSPIFNEKDEAMGSVHIAKDISMRKEIEKKERLAQLGKLVADMAHEVNNPLMIISGNAQLSLMEGTSSEEVKNNLKIIFEETKRAKDIIQRLLTFSRPSKGERKEVNINRSVDSVVVLLENQFKLANIEIKRNYSENLPLVTVDESQMREVFINLLNNGREAMASGGTIEVATFLEEGLIRLDFKDTGCGMTEEVRKRLFEPFFTTKEKGTGLGLPVCYGIIKAHNGDLTFKSEPNKGTTATILLPFGGASNA